MQLQNNKVMVKQATDRLVCGPYDLHLPNNDET